MLPSNCCHVTLRRDFEVYIYIYMFWVWKFSHADKMYCYSQCLTEMQAGMWFLEKKKGWSWNNYCVWTITASWYKCIWIDTASFSVNAALALLPYQTGPWNKISLRRDFEVDMYVFWVWKFSHADNNGNFFCIVTHNALQKCKLACDF